MAKEATTIDWHARAAKIAPRTQAFIDGKYVAARSGATFDCISPVDGRILAKIAACDEADVDDAVKAARKAFEDRRWAGLSPVRRKRVLLAFSELILKH